jgi:hypothetical protein
MKRILGCAFVVGILIFSWSAAAHAAFSKRDEIMAPVPPIEGGPMPSGTDARS